MRLQQYRMMFLGILYLLLNHSAVLSFDITGFIFDESTNSPLSGVTVRISQSPYGAISKKNGSFILKNIPAGKYEMLFSMVGYETFKMNYNNIIEGKELKINLNPQPFKTSEIVVSANKHVESVQEVPISLSVIDSRQIELGNFTKLDDALAYVPGVAVKNGNIDIRGSSGFSLGIGSRAALLLDGFPLISGDMGDIKFDAMPIDNIERVEIIKGAGSALYGTSALGGVVSVITSEPKEELELKINTYAGIYTKPRYEEWYYSDNPYTDVGIRGSVSKKFGDFGVIVSGGILNNQSFRIFDDSKRWNIFTKVKYDFSEKIYLSILSQLATDVRDDWAYWNGLDSATFPDSQTDRTSKYTSSKYSLFGEFRNIFDENNFLTLRVGTFYTHFETNHDKTYTGYRQSDANTFNTELQMNSKLFEKLLLTYGGNLNLSNITSFSYGYNSQSMLSLYSQAEITYIDNFIFTIGGRLDNAKTSTNQTNLQFSPKFGALYKSPFEVNFRASAGRGFRAPNAVERFATIKYNGFSVIPNPGLNPENSWSYEVGANYDFKLHEFPIQLDLAIYQNNLYDMIEPTLLEKENSIQFQNITRARIQGIEFGVKGFFKYFGIETSLSLMNPKDLDSNITLKYRSKILWYSRFILPLGPFELQADYRYISKIVNIDETFRLAGVKDYDARVPVHILDTRASFYLNKISSIPLIFSVNAKNLLDYYYTEVVGNLGMTRLLTLQIEVKY